MCNYLNQNKKTKMVDNESIEDITSSNLSDDNFSNSVIHLIKIYLEEYKQKLLFAFSPILNDSLILLNTNAKKIIKGFRSNKDEIARGGQYPTS